MSQSQHFHTHHERLFPPPFGAVPTVAASERLAFSLRALGTPGHAALRLAGGAGRGWRPVAGKLAAAARKRQPGQARQADSVWPARITGEPRALRPSRPPSVPHDELRPATLLLMVGLLGAGKTTRANELAAEYRALRLTPDEWMIQLFGESTAGRKRDILEGRLILVALQTLRLGTNVVLDFGLWGRDERSALRWLAAAAGASCQVVYLPVDKDVQRARIAHRQATAPQTTFPMTEADLDRWREQFQVPDDAELDGGDIPGPPPNWPGWPEWAAHRWPSLANNGAPRDCEADADPGLFDSVEPAGKLR